MPDLTAAQRRFLENATLIAALKLIFQKLEESGVPVCRLDEVADTTSGGTPKRGTASYYGGDIPWIKSGELNDGLITEAEESITQEALEKSSAKIYPKGTVVIALYGATVGKTGILGFDAASNQAVCSVTPKNGKVSRDFLFWFLRNKRQDFLADSFGGAQPNISQKILRETKIPLPPLEIQDKLCLFFEAVERRQQGDKSIDLPELPPPIAEQRRIVARIEELAAKIEEARGLRESVIEKASLLTKASLDDVFGKYLDSPEWSLIDLNSVTEIARGKFTHRPRNDPRFYGGKIPFIQIGDISGSNRYIQNFTQTLNDEGLKISRLFPIGTVVIAITGATVGATGILTFESSFPDSIVGIFPQEELVISEFIYWSLEFFKQIALDEAKQTTQPNINLKILNKLKIPLPPIAVQKDIVSYLDDIRLKVDQVTQLRENTLEEFDALLPAILDKAFKGEL